MAASSTHSAFGGAVLAALGLTDVESPFSMATLMLPLIDRGLEYVLAPVLTELERLTEWAADGHAIAQGYSRPMADYLKRIAWNSKTADAHWLWEALSFGAASSVRRIQRFEAAA
jgi:hypothetical protein